MVVVAKCQLSLLILVSSFTSNSISSLLQNPLKFHSPISMHSSFPIPPWIAFAVFLLTAADHLPISFSDPRLSEAGLFCGTAQPPPNVTYFPLFASAMSGLSQQVTADRHGHYTLNSTLISVYTLAQCHGDLSQNDCLVCYASTRSRLPRCLPGVSGRQFLDGCFLRYDDHDFYNQSIDATLDRADCNTTLGVAADSRFGKDIGELIDGLAASAVASGGFAVGRSKGVFGLAQCWSTVSRDGCKACLAEAKREVRTCLPNREGRALNTGCYLRYSTQKFYSNQTRESNPNSGTSRRGVIVAVSLSVVALCLVCLFAGYAVYRKWQKRKQERKNLGQILFSYNKSNLNFKYETLEKATNYFDPMRQLGQGGAGAVYKGTLPNGKTVAVKRLFFSTRQWVDEFFNEVNLISGIENKNLVKLLGCSIEGPESLLVYEFVPNRSLEHYLFDKKNKVKVLSWKERYNIIIGTAEGIAFLHGGLESRIIHRDIKGSNVLLDENFDPKIADFGLARLLSPDKTHLTTGIAGTLGYMAPEYLVKGQLTEKADVYSFGVLVMEIFSGKKNNAFDEGSGSLLQTIWKLYKTGRLTESVDPILKEDIPQNELLKVLRVGLLCAQAYAAERPSMVDVVKMLTDEYYEIPEPNQPPFLNANANSTSSTSSNMATKAGSSNPSIGTLSIQSFE